MKNIILLLLLISPFTLPQEKYFIYFNDKGASNSEALSKSSAQYSEALNSLSEKSVVRRKKVMGEDNFINYEDLPVSKNYISHLSSLEIKVIHQLTWFNSVSAYLSEEQIRKVNELSFVKKIEPVKKITFKRNEPEAANNLYKPGLTSLPEYGLSFNQLELSDIPAVHSKGITGEGVIVGMLDSGFDWQTHESTKDATIIDEYDFVFNDNVTANQSQDSPNQHNHGTLVFSVIGGFKDGTLIGAAYNADFLLAKTEYIPTETHVEEDNYAAALIWMEARGVDITSSSLGYNEFDAGQGSYSYSDMDGNTTIVTKAVEASFARGVINITSAGNEGNSSWFYIAAPADGFNVISVGAVSNNNEVAGFSSRGPTYDGRIKPEVLTQGVGVFGASAGTVGNYSSANGTSLSAPIASGVAALLLSAYPHLTNVQVRKIFLESSDNSTKPDSVRGYGLLSAANAISFPNLEKTSNSYKLHKSFLNVENIDPATPVLHYWLDDENSSETSLTFDGNYKYSFNFPFIQSNSMINFYYTYSDSTGASFREPQISNYRFAYGNLNIDLNIEDSPIPEDYILSQNYPNPFNSQTKINFVAGENEKAELIIIDAIGQKIKTLFSGLTQDGENIVLWDGKTENGFTASSGVYYYILKLSGKEYGRKMVLLK